MGDARKNSGGNDSLGNGACLHDFLRLESGGCQVVGQLLGRPVDFSVVTEPFQRCLHRRKRYGRRTAVDRSESNSAYYNLGNSNQRRDIEEKAENHPGTIQARPHVFRRRTKGGSTRAMGRNPCRLSAARRGVAAEEVSARCAQRGVVRQDKKAAVVLGEPQLPAGTHHAAGFDAAKLALLDASPVRSAPLQARNSSSPRTRSP